MIRSSKRIGRCWRPGLSRLPEGARRQPDRQESLVGGCAAVGWRVDRHRHHHRGVVDRVADAVPGQQRDSQSAGSLLAVPGPGAMADDLEQRAVHHHRRRSGLFLGQPGRDRACRVGAAAAVPGGDRQPDRDRHLLHPVGRDRPDPGHRVRSDVAQRCVRCAGRPECFLHHRGRLPARAACGPANQSRSGQGLRRHEVDHAAQGAVDRRAAEPVRRPEDRRSRSLSRRGTRRIPWQRR